MAAIPVFRGGIRIAKGEEIVLEGGIWEGGDNGAIYVEGGILKIRWEGDSSVVDIAGNLNA